MRFYFSTLAGHRRGVLILLGWSALEGVPAFFGGKLVGTAVDRGFAAGDPLAGVLWLLAFAALAVAGALGQRQVFARLGDVVEPMRDALVTRVVKGVLNDPAHRRTPDASAVAMITRHVEVVRDATAGVLVQARALLVTTVAALVGLATTAAALIWLVVLPIVAALLLFALMLPSLAKRQRDAVMADEHTAEASGAVLTGLRDVAACTASDEAYDDIATQITRQARATITVAWANSLRATVIALGGFAPIVLLVAFAPPLVASGRLTTGAVLAAVVYLTNSVNPALHGLARTTSTVVMRLMVALKRLQEAAPQTGKDDGEEIPSNGEFVLRDVTFGWSADAEPVLRDVSLSLKPGDHLAVVGPSGIGKSTMASLLTGLMPPDNGSVLFGGAPVDRVVPEVRHHAIALIPQETYLFTGTVRENLALLAPWATDEDLLDAVDKVGAKQLLDRLGGLDASLGHAGEGLSAGEAQLLALARVYVTSASVVILDEATSHLDPAAEARVERAFAGRDGILVVIAHRLSSALRANRVLVMDGGRPLLGTHEHLLKTSPLYGQLMLAWDPTRHEETPLPNR
ncbi:ABC transporter ATP-binding protein [Lentzea flava]|uniref:ABC transporter ATP-binding protein n=1 Tax=Lentzea flava TaxID=103732 RepID=A0ABQ2VBA8_9PSEU|nr:ABC transporter ATP-binding protein [Lentzea flava]MCP2200656.1 ATP-binding cassette, subfamily C [Lentzea flava]GGU77645.1 ABC transporter ATP-binding protein [Lentzea flava]